MKKLSIIALCVVLSGFGLMALARYKIRGICEKYPIEEQLKHAPCCGHGGPWPQKTNTNAKP